MILVDKDCLHVGDQLFDREFDFVIWRVALPVTEELLRDGREKHAVWI